MIEYSVLPLKITDKEEFLEATAEEMRVLLALIEKEGEIESREELSTLAGVSETRVSSAIAFWCEAGVIENESARAPRITDEFEERILLEEIEEKTAIDVASSIRDNNLADMINECTALMGRADLSTTDIKKLTALYDQYKLSAEYIVTLAAYLAEKDKLTVQNLVSHATKLAEKEIDTPEALEEYISEKNSDSEAYHAFRKVFGIYNRSLSKSEKECFTKWSRDFGYFTEIVSEAYDIATKKSRSHVAYADRLLTRWFECNCHTIEECKAQYERDLVERQQQYEDTAPQKKEKASQKKKERYGDFDVESAFLKALDRSYSSDKKD